MEGNNKKTLPVLISFRKLHLDSEDTYTQHQVKNKDPQDRSMNGARRKLPIRSFSLYSVFSNRKPVAKKHSKPLKSEHKDKIAEAVLEIERFEKDFVIPVLSRGETCQPVKTKSSHRGLTDGISNISIETKDKVFHSSTNSIHTETDSGAFSRLSSADSDSEFSEISENSQDICEM